MQKISSNNVSSTFYEGYADQVGDVNYDELQTELEEQINVNTELLNVGWYRNSRGQVPNEHIKHYLLSSEHGGLSGQNPFGGSDTTETNPEYEYKQYFFHSDHLGSSNYLTDITGETYQHVEYLPFGEVFLEERNTQQDRNTYLYNGKELDEETGYIHLKFRYYDPQLGRFIKVDPIAEDYVHVSPFNYAENEPVANIDLWGLQKLNHHTARAPKPWQYTPINADSWGTKGINSIMERYRNYQQNNPVQYTNNPNGRCIDIMNNVLSDYYSEPRESFLDSKYKGKSDLTSRILVERVDYTAKTLNDMGLITEQKSIRSNYHNEYVPYGEIESLDGSIVNTMQEMTNNAEGDFLFIISAGSGYHTTAVSMQNKKGNTTYTFMDTGNVKEMSPAELQDYYLGKANIMESLNAEERYNVKTNIYLVKPYE